MPQRHHIQQEEVRWSWDYTNELKVSVVIRNKHPLKLKDPRSISIPCVIEKLAIGKALCDLGASVTIMSLSLCMKLNIGEPKLINISLQLARISIVYLEGILEDIQVKVREFICLMIF